MAQVPQKPNVIIILTDDQGYNDVGCFGSELIKTPKLDQMAQEGKRFTDFYAAAPICTPSRAALMTGTYAQRIGLHGVLFPWQDFGLNPEEITIAELLKEQGYATACIGKWHLGEPPTFNPIHHGFDYFYGLPFSNDSDRPGRNKDYPEYAATFPRLMRNETVIDTKTARDVMTKNCTEESIQFIRANQEKPFFLYLSHPMPHVKLDATERFKGKSERGLYGDVIEELDWSVGEILETLKELQLDEKTLVIFTSDNGPWLNYRGEGIKSLGGNADPLRGGKFSTYEGGFRMPCIMWWPGKIPAGTTSTELATSMDLLPTIVKLAGGEVPVDPGIDGKDISALIFSEDDAPSPHEYFYYYIHLKLQAVRAGDWKLRNADGTIELFDLASDMAEANNVAEAHPELVSSLTQVMADFDRSLKAERRPAGKLEK